MVAIGLSLILLFAQGETRSVSNLASDPELMPYYYQGDIRTPQHKTRNGIVDEILHWPNATIPYVLEREYFANVHITQILVGMAIIEEKSCVRFRETTVHEDPLALIITARFPGCNTDTLGFRKLNRINLELADIGTGCFRIGTIIHEFLHILGFEHQHVAHNRDEYVRIMWENISKEFFINFVNDDYATPWHSYGERYDYDSVMHYVPKAFSKNNKDTIIPLKPGAGNMGQRIGMSISDVRKLNRMYKCPGYY